MKLGRYPPGGWVPPGAGTARDRGRGSRAAPWPLSTRGGGHGERFTVGNAIAPSACPRLPGTLQLAAGSGAV